MKKFHLLSWTGAALVLAILAAANYVLSVVPLRFDASPGRSYSISPATKRLLGKLDDRLLVRIVYSRDLPPVYKQNERYVADLLAEYRRASHGKIRVEYFDPAASPKNKELAMDYGVVPIQLDVMERDRREVAEKFMGVAFFYGDKVDAIPFVCDVQGLEYEISVRIRKLVDPTKPVLGLITNGNALAQGSQSLSGIDEALTQIYDLRSIDANQPIPSDVRAALWIGPTMVSSPTVSANLNAYLAGGGALGLFVDRYDVDVRQFRAIPVDPKLDDLLAGWGLGVDPGIIVDPQCDRIQVRASQGQYSMVNILDYPYFPLITAIDRTNPASKGVDAFTTPFCAPVTIRGAKPGLSYAPVARTSGASYLDKNPLILSPLNEPERPPNAPAGPFNVAVLVQGKFNGGAKPGRLVVFGTSRIIRSEYPARPSNFALFLNFADWLAQDQDLVQIRSRGFERRPLRDLPDAARFLVKALMILFLPLASMATGLFLWRRQVRRRRRVAAEYGTVA